MLTSALARVNMESIDFMFTKEKDHITEVLFMFIEPTEDMLINLPYPVKDCILAYWAAKDMLFCIEEKYSIN